MNDRRRSERYAPDQVLIGKVKSVVPANILDISRHGLQIEVPTALRPAVQCDVTLPLEGEKLQLRARISRCSAQGFSTFENGERKLMYRAGLEFIGLEGHALELLESQLDELRAKASPHISNPPEDPGPVPGPRRDKPIKIKVNTEDIRRRADSGDVS